MAGHELTVERRIEASPEAVWAVITDLDNAADTLTGVTRVERLTPGPYQEGTRWRETRKMWGKSATEELYVTTAEAPHRTVVEADNAGVHYVTSFTLNPIGHGTHVAVVFSADHGNPSGMQRVLWRMFAGMGLKATAKLMQQDLDDIARRAESS